MRFRAAVPKDAHALLLQVTQQLRRVELTSSGVGRRCVLRLSKAGLSFGLVCAADDCRAWADLDPALFEAYMVESRCRGEVLLHLSLKQLVRALQKHSGDTIQLRLAKNAAGAPQLRLASQKRSVVLRTDVPVKVMRSSDAGAYAPPALAQDRGVVLDLPGGGRGVARVVARLRRLGDRRATRAAVRPIRLTLAAAGELAVTARAPTCAVRAFFPDCAAPRGVANAPGAATRVRVDAGRLAAALGLEKLDPEALSCEKASDALRVVAKLRDALGLVCVYVPALVDDDEDEEEGG